MDYGSIIGGIIGGLFTYLGVLATIKYQEKNWLRLEARKKEEQEKEAFNNRPRFSCVNHGEIKKLNIENEKVYDLDVLFTKILNVEKKTRLHFSYDERILDRSKWSHIEYELKNIGHTEISHLYISTNLPKDTALFRASESFCHTFYNTECLNYSECLDKYIKPGESIKININYLDDSILSGMFSASVTLWIIDINGRYWQQPLFAPSSKIYDTRLTDHKTFRNQAFVDDALKCFENPYLW